MGQVSRLSAGRPAPGASDPGETPGAAGGTPAPLPLEPPVSSVGRLGYVKLMQDLLRAFGQRPHLGIHQHMGLSIIRLTLGEKVANFCQWFRLVQAGPVGWMPDPLEGFCRP